ncbi:hypothetical protein BGZ96_005203 [Linnemannia gamsii]|uniref:Extracellular membrane protein CFEM domain-containing protein n=1 Tax=Linnemannia gamsii TaxID=64522 RepID=A0ABQ7K579_9FUNG|nr:hypothetical protein BGZ96_005203 [Linnemannia gamsii]
MRFSTIFAAATMALLSAVSAQSTVPVPDPAVVAACNACVATAGVAAVPACKGLEKAKVADPNAPTDQMRACWCGLATNKTWANKCVESKQCPLEAVEALSKTYQSFVAKPGTCDNLPTPLSGAASGAGSASAPASKVAVAAGAVLAMAGALL